MATQLGWRSNQPGSNLEFVDEDSPLPVQHVPDAVSVYVPYALDQITIDATAGGVGLTPANVRDAKRVVFYVETAQIRYVTTPTTLVTSAVGILGNINDQILLLGPEISAFRAIRTGAASATITVEYSR